MILEQIDNFKGNTENKMSKKNGVYAAFFDYYYQKNGSADAIYG